MKIVFTNHAKCRIMERQISVQNVRQTIKNPDSRKEDVYGMITTRKVFGKRTLEIIYRVSGNTVIIITTYYL